jgi:adenine-specific DNA-methyltransferase
MPDTDTPIPASQNFTRLKAKLRELFELDKADLDFGIYRVLRQRHTEIAEFLDKHLETTVRSALSSHGDLQGMQIKHDLEKAESAAQAAGISAEQSPRVMELRSKLEKGSDLEATADEVYSHLLTFFSRYYQGGDFLGLHRSTVHGQERYMIPYNGEEVKLIWANMDQYYIKSSELLRDYNFKVSKNLGEIFKADPKDIFTVQFKLIEGDTEKDNRKADSKSTRAFSLDTDTAFVEADERTLTLHFRYREHPSERSLQDKLNADTEKTLADTLPPKWKELLFAADPSYQPKDKKDSRTVFHKHLRSYTAKHHFDYFIHKDLGGFLRRELDFYVKNEVMHLDDIEDTTAPKAEEYLSKIRAIRRCALPVIRMVAQLEEFQKKLWLKKKFVVETRYCLTLDRVPEMLYPEICACYAQWQEWDELVALADLKPKRTPEFLKAHPYLMIDTRHFAREFTLKLLASIENLDASLDGVCFHSENFQALQLMQERYREQVKCVYTDPPFNTSEASLLYKNEYRHSSWLTMVQQSLVSCRTFLSDESVVAIAIDDFENEHLSKCLDQVFTPAGRLGTLIVEIKPSGRTTDRFFATSHEFYHFFGVAGCTAEIAFFKLSEEAKLAYNEADDDGAHKWRDFLRTGGFSTPEERPNSFYPIYYNPENNEARLETFPGSIEILPIDSEGKRRVWRKTPPSFLEHYEEKEIKFEQRNSGQWKVLLIDRIKDGVRPKSVWVGSKYDAASHGTKLLKKLFGTSEFGFPKALGATQDVVFCAMGDSSNGVVADFFGGSGTTGHAVINLNREDKGQRKYLLVEMGEHFETVLVPRLKKVVYSTDWKEGKPQSRNTGISHAFKIVRLEGYEDTLNNLHLRRTPEQAAALAKGGETNRDQYLLGYFLDVESAGSKSLLDLAQFRDPFAYKLNIATSSAGETKETTVDLVETFNWLLGLKVKHIDHQRGFITVTGERRAGGRCLILWRSLSTDEKADNAALVKYLEKVTVSPADTEYDFIYVNGPHTLNDPHNKVHLIEETFHRLMFDTTNFESLS